ncbi:MAG: carotenoid 1,2-hydratase [Chloroflexi bacterium]|nr:carotenoid 1,2-hydratase [Chloroflexota bacterium]
MKKAVLPLAWRRRGLRISLVFVILVVNLVGCTSQATKHFASASVVEAISSTGDDTFAHATTPRPFTFPHDHGPHPEYRTEWWYYTGNLQDAQGKQYGYQLTFFRSGLTANMPARTSDLATNQFYMAHFAITSQPANQHVSFENFSRGAGGLAGATGDPRYQVWLEDWSVKQTDAKQYQLQATAQHATGAMALNLTLNETRPPLLHGDQGLSQKGPEPGNANYYYSLINVQTTGSLTFAGQTFNISGVSWMDHEFGTSSLGKDITGWNWFSAQLDNGAVLMFGTFHDGKGESRYVYEGSLLFPDNRKVRLQQGDFEVKVLDEWKSPVTGFTYPSGWQVRFPQYNIEFEMTPLIRAQEMEVRFIYYEGAITIKGTMDGAPVTGQGYVELTGYGEELNEYQR